MDKEKLTQLVEDGLSQIAIAKEMNCSASNITYWLKKYDLRTRLNRSRTYNCAHCGESDPSKFYGNKISLCGSCHNVYTKTQGYKKKRWVVDLLGGKCQHCGYDSHMAALHIHHLDKSKKDPKFSQWRGWSRERIIKEIEECAILCANCHAIEHCSY